MRIRMLIVISLIAMLLPVVLTSCATQATTPSVQSTLPTVNCGEHAPAEHLAIYPDGPVLLFGAGSDIVAAYDDAATDAERRRIIIAAAADHDRIIAFSILQTSWSINAAGVVRDGNAKRTATASCLDAFRARNIIK